MRKFLITMMCIVMVVCFMPTVAFGEVGYSEQSVITVDTYESLARALEAAQSGDTIILGNDIKFHSEDTGNDSLMPILTIDKDLTLDLNNFAIEYDDATKVERTSERPDTPAFFEITSGAKVIITGDGTINCEAGDNNAYGININNEDSSLIIENGTFYGALTAVQVQQGSLYIKDGFFDMATTCKAIVPQYAKYVVNCIDRYYRDGSAKICICGGSFANFDPSKMPEGVDTSYVVPGYVASQATANGETIYSINLRDASVAKVTDSNGNITGAYNTLSAAVSAAENGDTVTLISDTAETQICSAENKSITIDGNGHKIESTAKHVLASNYDYGYTDRNGAQNDYFVVKNVEIIDKSSYESTSGIITWGNLKKLELNNVSISIENATSSQPINISGYDTRKMEVDIINSTIKTDKMPKYSIICWQPVDITIDNSQVGGYAALYMKSATSGTNGTNGSTATIKNGTNMYGVNNYSGNSDDFATIMLEDSNINVKIIDSTVKAVANNAAWQHPFEFSNSVPPSNCLVEVLGESQIILEGENAIIEQDLTDGNQIKLYSGLFSKEPPQEFLADNKYVSKESSADDAMYLVHDHSTTCNFGHVYCPATCPDTCHTLSHYVPTAPTTPTDNVTNSGTSGTDNATTSADLSGSTSTSDGTTTSTVDQTTADKIVDKAVANESSEIVIDATASSTSAASSTTTAQVTIPTETLGAIAEKTEADVTIKTDVAEVKLDNAAAAAVADQATGDTVQIIAEKVKEDATEVHFELKVVCSNGTVISDFKGGNVSVTVTLPKTMAEKKLVCVYIDDQGHMSKVEGQKNADGTYTFTTTHFSTYAIMAEDEADAAIAAQTEAIKNIKIKLSSKQIKTKTGKKAVKVTWTAAAGDKTLDGVEVYRSTQRYKGYGKEPFFTSTKGGNKGSYINTKSLKKGTRYYYRVRGYILVNGEKVYTDYSTKAWRTVK